MSIYGPNNFEEIEQPAQLYKTYFFKLKCGKSTDYVNHKVVTHRFSIHNKGYRFGFVDEGRLFVQLTNKSKIHLYYLIGEPKLTNNFLTLYIDVESPWDGELNITARVDVVHTKHIDWIEHD